jgi:hypothetical protein
LRRVPPLHLAALVAYCGVLVAELSRLSGQLRANSDVASVLLVGNSLAAGTAGRPIEAGQPAYAWLVDALNWVGHETVLWTVLPLAITWLGLAGAVLAVARVSSRWPAGLALALGVGAAPSVLLTELAPAFHGMAWGAVGLLGWYTVVTAGRPTVKRRSLLLAAGAGLLAGAAAASDALVIVAGLVPLAAVAAMLFLRTRQRDVLGPFCSLAVSALVSFTAIHLLMARAGYSSGLGGGTTRGIGLHALAANARVVGRGLLDMANGLPMEPGAGVSWLPLGLAVALIVLAAAGICFVMVRAAWPTDAGGGLLARQAHVLYWVVSAVLLLGALLVSNVIMPGGDSPPADRLVSSQRYLTGIFFAAVALVPLWPRTRTGRLLATIVATIFIATSAVRLVGAESSADFQPSASRAVPVLQQALLARGLSHGYASYWDADVLRWASGGALDIVPAAEGTPCGAGPTAFCRDLLNSVGGWFTAQPGRSFVVVDPDDGFIPAPPPASLGTPAETFGVDRFTVYVYSSDVLKRFASSCAGRADHNCAG